MRKTFFYIEPAPDSRHFTTLTHQGLRQYKRMPIEIKGSVSVCQRLVSQTLADCFGTISYIDDILILGSTRAEHDSNLRMVLQRLRNKDFRLLLAKCEFAVPKVTFLRHVISANGIQPDYKNVQPISNAPTPKTVECEANTKFFLGMVNYYSRFINDLATTAEPLRRLTRKNVRFSWTAACQSAFDEIKHANANSVHSFFYALTSFTTDASDRGLGAVLSQTQQGREVHIAHISHTLQPRERRYAVNEREALACVGACENWEEYLLGRHLNLRTYHSSLASLIRSITDRRKSTNSPAGSIDFHP
ncbi:hypothetical protein PoB_000436900 [Plakobranchus ocellatus]|uniref:Reverse transcriptase domain-containing protein n=1 Tax=Plakobranchus ocellatus TaxID=259542 RepID=A0AAV3Y4H8_9GAST|nr:hypothetical protein PoB_000436900 [Plakobranchus ocellatus]